MTTPNNQPTPPEGMEILTDYTQVLPEGACFFSQHGLGWCPEEGHFRESNGAPYEGYFYAIPITPTVPATGDTTNEKGGEQREELQPQKIKASIDGGEVMDDGTVDFFLRINLPASVAAERKLGDVIEITLHL